MNKIKDNQRIKMKGNNAKKENESEYHYLFSDREEWCRIKYGLILTKKDIQNKCFKFLKRGIKVEKYWVQSIWWQKNAEINIIVS